MNRKRRRGIQVAGLASIAALAVGAFMRPGRDPSGPGANIEGDERDSWVAASTFVLKQSGAANFHGLRLRLLRVERKDPADVYDDLAEIHLFIRDARYRSLIRQSNHSLRFGPEVRGASQWFLVREGDKFRFGDYAVNVLKVAPDFVSPSRNAKGEARIAIEWVGEGSPRASPGESKAASWIGSTHELVRGGQVEVRGLIARLVRIKENDPNDPGDDSIELSLVTDTQSKQLTLREFDTVFIEDFEITAHEVVPLHPMHAELPYPVEKGEGSVRLSIRRLTPPAPAGRPIG